MTGKPSKDNLRKEKCWWGMVAKGLKKMGATVQARVMMYTGVVHMVLLYGSKSWLVTEEILKVLEGFHYGVARMTAGMPSPRVGEGGREWSLVE